ncbi:hypothetical protein Bbelb_385860 [Branchiostoma belcheri]|nr:hypothetical protein Bbelb_385860 [Branchiostoma belcheri]
MREEEKVVMGRVHGSERSQGSVKEDMTDFGVVLETAYHQKTLHVDGKDEKGELHCLWRDHVGIRPRYAGRGASASRSLTSDINNTPPCVLSSNSNKCSSSALCSDTVSQVCVARGPDVRNVSYPNRGLGDSV